MTATALAAVGSNANENGTLLISGTAVTASGSSVDFTGIPSWVKRITVMFNGVSTNGTSGINVQLGTSSGIENTNYVCGNVYFSANAINGAIATTGFSIRNTSAADSLNGSVIISLLSNSTNTWAAQGILGSGNSANNTFLTSGSKSLAGTLDRVRITTVNGTDTFDAGTINIMWE